LFFALTNSGSWVYLEYPEDIDVKGSYLYESAGSTHTLHARASNTQETEICFVMNGTNFNEAGEVQSVVDAGTVLDVYIAMCEAQGKENPSIIGYSLILMITQARLTVRLTWPE